MKEEAARIAVRLWLGLGGADDVERWAAEVISGSNDVDPLVYEMISAERDIRPDLFTDFARTRLGFECVSRQGVTYVEEVLADQCGRVLQKELAVPPFCQIIRKLDAAFGDARIEPPEGVSDLWNACDWCEDGWTLDNQPHLEENLAAAKEKILKKLSDGT